MSIDKKNYQVTMSNGEVWSVPVSVIALHRARYYAKKYDGDLTKSYNEDTLPLFEDDFYEIEDWAKNNMNWCDISAEARLISASYDYQDAWVESDARVSD